jgi:FkbM family methyltransferase
MRRRSARRRSDPVALANGLRVHGVSKLEAQTEHFIRDYFRPGFEFRPGMTVFDVGANVGMFSLEILRRCAADVDVFAFEPAPETFDYLTRNIREQFPSARTRLFRCAVGAHPGARTFYYRPRAPYLSSLIRDLEPDDEFARAWLREPPPEFGFGPLRRMFRRLPHGLTEPIIRHANRGAADSVEIECNVVTLSEVIQEHGLSRIDFLKVDVEGSELDVLRGIESQDWPKIHRLAAEVDDVDGRLEAIRELLEGVGFNAPEVRQQWPFEGTRGWIVHATRSARALAHG